MQKNLHGITLIEMMVALVLTLVIMGTVVTVFGEVSNSVAFSRAGLEMADRLRLARTTLQNDLANCTCPTIPWRRPESNEGYFEYVEGIRSDSSPSLQSFGATSLVPTGDGTLAGGNALGDFDDVLMMTVHNPDSPFIGRDASGNPIESNYAEVVWFAVENPVDGSLGEPGMRTIYRRVLLIAPSAANMNTAPNTDAAFYVDCDISSRPDPSGTGRIANTLADLTKRENRYWHDHANGTFPHVATAGATTPFPSTSAQFGTDVMLSNALAFDVRAYDPGAPVDKVTVDGVDYFVSHGDAGQALAPGPPVGYGAYVDLGYGFSTAPTPGIPSPRFNDDSRLYDSLGNTYCTWSEHYEHDGIDQNLDGDFDEGTNGLDDDGNGIVDDAVERETVPPYASPLRGIQVRIRAYEPDSRQIRQVSVVQSFVPL